MNIYQLLPIFGVWASILVFCNGLKLWQVTSIDPFAMLDAESRGDEPKGARPRTGLKQQLLQLAKRYAQLANRYEQLNDLLLPVDIEQRLDWAGNPLGIRGKEFIGVQIVFMGVTSILGLYIGLMFFGSAPGMIIALGLICGVLGAPIALMWLNQEAEKRQQRITQALPDAIDLISTSMVAGLNLERAIEQVVQNIDGPLHEELNRFLHNLQLGTPRQDAYRGLMRRNKSAEIQTIVGALLQGQNLGVPVSQTLEEQSEVMRERRIRRAKEMGEKIAPKISLITIFFVTPSIFIMFLSIMGYNMLQDIGPALEAFIWAK